MTDVSLKLIIINILLFTFVNGKSTVNRYENIECVLHKELIDEIQLYKEDVNKIVNFVLNGDFKGRIYRE